MSARKLIRGLLPVVVAAGAAVTCDSPTGPARHLVALAIQPVLRVALGTFGGMSVDQARLIVVRPPADTVATKSFDFSADSAQITANVSVPVTDTATFWVTIQLLSGNTLMFSGLDTVLVTSVRGEPSEVLLTFVGPGTRIASIQIAPRDSGVSFGGSLQFRLTAADSSQQPVTQFYAAWSTPSSLSGAGNTINADGLFRAGTTRGTAWVYAHTPTGIRDSTRVTVSPVPSQVVIVSGNNQTGSVGTVLEQPLVVRVLASDNLPVSGVSVQFSASGGGSLNPPAAMTDSLGLAHTIATLGTTAGSVAITASVGSVAQTQFTATATQQAGPPANLVKFAGDAQTGATGAAVLVAPAVKVTDASNTPLSGIGVTFAVASGGGSVTGASATTNASGIATVGSWTLGAAAGNNTLTATVTGLSPVTFAATAVSPGVPVLVTKTAGDGQTAAAGSALPVRPAVKVTDGLGTRVAGVSVTFAVASGGGSITGGTVTTDTGGIATVGSWTLGPAAGANTLTATVTGLTAVTFAATGTTVVGPAIVLTVPGNLVGVGAQGLALVKLTQPAPTGGLTVTVTSDSTRYLTVASPGTIAFSAGDTLRSIVLNGVAVGASVIHATATGYTAGITAVGVTPNLILLQQLVSVTAGQSTTLGVQIVPAAPAGGLAVTLASTDTTKLKVTTPTVTIAAGQTTGSATIHGVAPGLVGVTASATGYASGGVAITVASASGPAATLTLVSGGNQTATPGAQLPNPIVVKVADSLGIGVSGKTVTFAVATGGGSVLPTSGSSDANGLASTAWTLGAVTGAQTITATATGLAGSPLTVSANVPGGVASTTVSPKPDTLTALTATVQLTAQARDSNSNPLTGSFIWLSRTPAIATVSASGRVTAVANGSTYVVATEAGGTKDSALIVVQQRLASINVSGRNSLYLNTSYSFTASAVDGLGKPMPGITSFTWSTTAPAVATVDTAGHVSAIGLGTAQIRATSGTITGIANLSVITPITRIAVVVDTVGATRTDTFTLTSLGLTRRYRAIAHDTLDAVMTGISFTWVSTNGSVAVVPSITSDTVSATSAANGVTQIKATAQGFTSNPGASLTVAQVLASIQLTPPAVTIAVNGSTGLVARGKDANGRYISGGTFTFTATNPAITTVDSTGRVTGVANGTDTVTATSAAIVSNNSVVTVGGEVPAIISFARDTLSVGRGSSASIPILLSKPATSPLIVKLAVRDTFAYWSTPTVTIPTGATSINATLNGHNAGTTVITASDSSGLGYAGASAVLAVTATMRLASSYYAINATDITSTQVLLSDPSPAGGTYVTFNFGTAGIAAVSPNPAYIPAGQLAANIQINALAAGTTTITPNAIGVNGTASSFTAYAPVLRLSSTFSRLGQGQYDPNPYVYIQTSTDLPIPVAFTSSDTTVAKVTPAVTIPSGSNYAYFTITAQGNGTATITPSAPGWTAAASITVVTTTPHVGVCCTSTLYTTSPQQSVYVYSEDSSGTSHYRVNSLLANVSSSNPNVVRVIDSVVTIDAGSYYTTARVVPGGLGGTAYIRTTASGHTPDSVLYTVNGPPLNFSWSNNRVGAGEYDQSLYVYTQNSVTAPLVVTLTNSDTTKVGVPDSVIIPSGTNYVYFNVLGLAPGSVTIGATAPGFLPTSASYTVTSPRITACCNDTFNNFNSGTNLTFYSADSVGTSHYRSSPLAVSITVLDTMVAKVDSATVTIGAGTYYNNSAHVTPVGVGTTRIVFSAPGQLVYDTLTITVNTPKIQFSFYSSLVGRRQYLPNLYIYTPDYRATPLGATITPLHSNVDSLSATADTIPVSTNYVYFTVYGLALGTDTLIVSAPGYAPDTAYITVSWPRFTASGLPGSLTTTSPPFTTYVYAADSAGTDHYVMDTVVVAAAPSDSTVLQPAQRSFRILPGTYYNYTTTNVVGPGSASITYSDSAGTGYHPDTTNTVTVTGPSLVFNSSSSALGMRQTSGSNGYYVYAANNVATPLVVHLLSTGTRVATVPDSVIIPANSNYVYFGVTGQDTVGTIQITATATGYSSPTPMTVQVTPPQFAISTSTQLYTTSGRTGMTIYAEDQFGTQHYTTENVVVSLLSSAPSVANVDSSTVTIPAGQYYVNTPTWGPGIVGTSQLQASDPRAALYHYNTGTLNVAVIEPSLNFNWGTQTLGIGQYNNQYVYSPNNAADAINVTLSHNGTARTSTTLNGTPVSAVTIPSGINYVYFHVVGAAVGWDTLVASATTPAFYSATGYTAVSQGHVDPISYWPSSLSLSGTDSVQVLLYARDSTQTTHYVEDSVTFTLAPNANIQFVSGGANSAVITSIVIPQDQYYVYFWVKGVAQGTGQATISATNYVTYNTPAITVSP